MTERDESLVRRLRSAAEVIIVNLSEIEKREADMLAYVSVVFLECADTIEILEDDAGTLASIKRMQQDADGHVIITGVEATVDQLEARVALCVKACTNMSNDALEYIGNVRSEGLFRYKKRHEEIVADLEAKCKKLEEKVDELSEPWVDAHGTHWNPPTSWAYAQVCHVMKEQRGEIEQLSKRDTNT
jgi:hypothetical protein